VGAGIAGLATASMLATARKSVVLLDDGPIGGGMTQITSAHLPHAIDDRYFELERLHGRVAARLAAESHTAAIARIESIARQERIECQFERVDGYLFLAEGDREETLDQELDAAHRAGLSGGTKLPRAPYGSFGTGPCLRFPRQAQFHPLMALAGLTQALHRAGGRIYSGSRAEQIEGGTPAVVRVGAHVVTADAVVVATNVPVNDRVAIHTKQAPYMTYVIGARVPRGSVSRVLAWDTGDPYHYVRVAEFGDDELLIVGGEDHKTGQADDANERHERLESWTRPRFPMAREVAFRWSGQI